MKKNVYLIFLAFLTIYSCHLFAEEYNAGFNITVLGAKGGIQDGNITSFMISPTGDDNAVLCDAGTVVNGLIIANEKGAFDRLERPDGSTLSKVGYILKERIKGYLISHAHLDHIAGLIIASPDDSAKPIYGLSSTIDTIKNTHFNWQSWANFADSGTAPALNKYNYVTLKPATKQHLINTTMDVTAFSLSHTQESTAFLIEHDNNRILCFGDTAADSVSNTNKLLRVWKAAALSVKSGALKAIIIENSYTNDRPDHLLFGHLTPKYLLQELHKLEMLAGGKGSLAGLPVIISHIKYSLLANSTPIENTILKELTEGNDMQVKFIIPKQGEHWTFN
jgi:3',5'-cyclic-nucleotide phosphodiesterase